MSSNGLSSFILISFFTDFPRVTVGPENPIKVEKDDTAQLQCGVDSKPTVNTVKWLRNGRFIDTHFKHTIPRVTLQDAGSYVCSADNGLGQVGKAELQLDVLHAPIVSLPESREVKEGTDTTVECDIVANPRPATIQWTKEGDEKFHQNGPTLRLNNVNARHNGKYTCSATNQLQPTGKAKTLRTSNATIEINVRHPPGKAFISPDKPTAVDGKSATLTCGAKPPGYPAPRYRWWKEGTDGKTLSIGESIDESNAGLARDLRLLVRERLVAGDTDAEVVDFVVARFGEYVLLNPRRNGANLILWLAGPVLLLGGIAVAALYLRRQRPKAGADGLSEDEKARLDDLLKG